MSVIKVMSDDLANKIAAGEVVERCSSIVKELVENSIDAKSKIIKVDLVKGGLDSIIVIDDGIGMDSTDAHLAFERHATSKIYKDDDLFFIETLGFRGEALPSIASVSEVILETCKDSVGTLLHIKGGKLIEDTSSNARIGTKIEVKNLFYNTPARLKHLKNEVVELSYITNLLERLALSHPDISFELNNNDKRIFKTTGSNDLLKTIHEIYGIKISSNMLKVHALSDDYEIDGYVSKPEILKSNRNHLITFINGRLVKNYEINKAINDAYYTYKPEGKYPVVVLNIYTDPTLVDVNIHPTKQDVKISKMNDLYDLLYDSIKTTLYNNLLIPNVLDDKKEEVIEEKNVDNNVVQTSLDLSSIFVEENTINKELKKIDLVPIGIAFNTYIICQSEETLYLIDQHAAQERINYENFYNHLKSSEVNTTKLLIPISIELPKSEYIKFIDNSEVFTSMGFTYEEFGINTILIKEHPTWLKKGEEEVSIKTIVDLIIQNGTGFDVNKFREHVAITLACKKAIKAHDHISMLQVEELLKNLMKCDNPYNCPHGRPTMISFSTYELEKMFKRVMN